MAAPEVSPQQGLILQRGQAELLLHKLDDRLTVAFRDQDVDLLEIVPGLMYRPLSLCGKDFFMQEVIVPPEDLESVLDSARQSDEILFASHVYQLAYSIDSFVYLTNQLTVQFAQSLSPYEHQGFGDRHGLKLVRPVLGLENTFIYELTKETAINPIKLANQLRILAGVNVAEANVILPQESLGFDLPTDTLFQEQWYLHTPDPDQPDQPQGIDAVGAWETTKGDRSIVIAVTDDAIDLNHPDFQGQGKIVAPYDFGERDFLPTPEHTQESHGTACAGLAVAEETGTGIVGVAPDCALMPLKTTGYLDDDSIESLFLWAVEKGADVISCSWNAAAVHFPLSLRQNAAIHYAATAGREGKGCVIVFAAGNANRPLDGTIYERSWHNKMLYGPTEWLNGYANHPDVIAVSACTSQNQKAVYSNWGSEISVCAPSNNAPPVMWFAEHGYLPTAPEVQENLAGQGILSTDVMGEFGYSDGHFTRDFGGTSSACPLVAGVAALVLSANPMLSAAEVKEILENTADKIVDSTRDRQLGLQLGTYDALGHSRWFGYGKVNARRAVEAATNRFVDVEEPEFVVEQSNDLELEIPDGTEEGITSLVAFVEQGRIRDISVTVEIDHEYMGDVEVHLRTPNGKVFLLQNRSLGSRNYLQKTYTPVNTPGLKQLIGLDITGEWTLWVLDLSPTDVGSLKNWSLQLKY
ncbi:peptidase S8 and S53 subtilisin kexin sedolisin [[Leptolyngbya] sp. PCC 7376]|uniref:S8 family serine peptidase n=1 Tax=[Leptolyngbya] sp. PCC 7376 TaxID=111781 RepID=UPI00029EF326|nr:S8 family serine peptidase [[Leptolyngbya] sp. PCC 7376]AFY38700.1 peptidase S8 and S53 subtilisin kexin sedolisin [[Leptolyngbya] sp. PCC 7376]